jgi:hypothetical protein
MSKKELADTLIKIGGLLILSLFGAIGAGAINDIAIALTRIARSYPN